MLLLRLLLLWLRCARREEARAHTTGREQKAQLRIPRRISCGRSAQQRWGWRAQCIHPACTPFPH
jgi:hypothetical protein